VKIQFAHQRPGKYQYSTGKCEIEMQQNFYIPKSQNYHAAKMYL